MTGAFRPFDGWRVPALSGGRAPRLFLESLARSGQWRHRLALASAWMGTFFDAVPGFGRGPLFGALLGPLADQLLQPQRVMTAAGRIRSSRSDEPRAAASRSAGAAGMHTTDRPPGMSAAWTAPNAAALNGVPGSGPASSPFGSSVLESSAAIRRQAQAAAAALAAASRRAMALAATDTPPGADAALRRTLTAGTGPSAPALADWHNRVAERVMTRLITLSPAATTIAAATSVAVHDAWHTPLDGPAADLALLLRGVPAAATSAAAVAGGQHEDEDEVIASSAIAGPSGVSHADRHVTAAAADRAVSMTAAAWPERSASEVVRQLATDLVALSHDDPWMPPLLPSVHAPREAPSGLAPAHLSRTEIAPLESDLEEPGEALAELASRMKRVLDEEARRHGIDV
jgi:hypothetical protein